MDPKHHPALYGIKLWVVWRDSLGLYRLGLPTERYSMAMVKLLQMTVEAHPDRSNPPFNICGKL